MLGTWENPWATKWALQWTTLPVASFLVWKTHFEPMMLAPASKLTSSHVPAFCSVVSSLWIPYSHWSHSGQHCASAIVMGLSVLALAMKSLRWRVTSMSSSWLIAAEVGWVRDSPSSEAECNQQCWGFGWGVGCHALVVDQWLCPEGYWGCVD